MNRVSRGVKYPPHRRGEPRAEPRPLGGVTFTPHCTSYN